MNHWCKYNLFLSKETVNDGGMDGTQVLWRVGSDALRPRCCWLASPLATYKQVIFLWLLSSYDPWDDPPSTGTFHRNQAFQTRPSHVLVLLLGLALGASWFSRFFEAVAPTEVILEWFSSWGSFYEAQKMGWFKSNNQSVKWSTGDYWCSCT